MEQIIHIIEQAQIDLDGKNLVNNFDEFRDYVENSKLSDDEKNKAVYGLIRQRDIQNLVWYNRLESKCSVCNYNGRTTLTCERCIREYLEKQFGKWTTGDEELDREIQVVQREVPYPLLLVEWIPIEELTNIEPLDSGACSEIFSATWKKGLAYDFRDNRLIREKDTEVSLKKIPKRIGYKEIVINLKAKRAGFGVVPCYGITRNEEGYMLVLMRMVNNMSNYLEKNRPLSRQQIDNILWSLSSRLCQLHRGNIIHNDLHPGNFMIGKGGEWNLIDLGFSLTNDENRRRHGDSDSKESDIYTFAAMMCEVITGCPLNHDNSDRPILPTGIPEDYRKIIEMCLDPEPNKRPKSEFLVCFFRAHMEECP